MADINLIFPRELVPAATVAASDVIPVDNGTVVQKATPVQIVDAGRPFATQGQAEAGTDATVAMSPLTTRQAIDALAPSIIQPFVDLAEAWAESPTAPDPGVPTSKSSKTWAGQAEASATAAAGSASSASGSATAAGNSATAAANSAASITGMPLVRYDVQTLTTSQRTQVQTNIGGTAVGRSVFSATDAASARSNIGLSSGAIAAQSLGVAESSTIPGISSTPRLLQFYTSNGEKWGIFNGTAVAPADASGNSSWVYGFSFLTAPFIVISNGDATLSGGGSLLMGSYSITGSGFSVTCRTSTSGAAYTNAYRINFTAIGRIS